MRSTSVSGEGVWVDAFFLLVGTQTLRKGTKQIQKGLPT